MNDACDEHEAHDALGDCLRRMNVRAWLAGPFRPAGSGVRRVDGFTAVPAQVEGGGHGGLHVVAGGGCRLTCDECPAGVSLAMGEAVLLPGGRPHELRASGSPAPQVLSVGYELAGALAQRLSSALPGVVHLGRVRAEALALLAQVVLREHARRAPGAEALLARTLELMVLQALRGACDEHPALVRPVLAARIEPAIAETLRLMDAEPGRRWTVTSLAHAACMSRSVYASRFTAQLGVPPHRRLLECRMHAAARLLEDGNALKEVAAAVGYRSRAAFSKAFRVWTGRAPGRFRAAVVPAWPAGGPQGGPPARRRDRG